MVQGGRSARGTRLDSATALLFLLLPALAAAAEGEAQSAPEVTSGPEVTIGGRVFARASSDERSEWNRDLGVASARVELEARFGIAEAVMEAELAGGNLIKDAYVRVEPIDELRFYAGQFRSPFLGRSLVGRWDLPTIDRGFVEDYLTETHQLAGRRLGVMGEYKIEAWRELEFQFGAFQGAQDEVGQRLGEDYAARVAFEPWNKRLDVGVNAYWANPTGASRFAAGADAAFDLGGFRLWGEVLAGRLAIGRFTSQLVMAAWRMPLGSEDTWALEPFVAGEALQLFGDSTGMAMGALGGVSLHYGDRIRLQTQIERALRPGDAVAATEVAVQLGARF